MLEAPLAFTCSVFCLDWNWTIFPVCVLTVIIFPCVDTASSKRFYYCALKCGYMFDPHSACMFNHKCSKYEKCPLLMLKWLSILCIMKRSWLFKWVLLGRKKCQINLRTMCLLQYANHAILHGLFWGDNSVPGYINYQHGRSVN